MQKFETAEQLAQELKDFNREQELPTKVIPPANVLRLAERHDLLTEIQCYGGAVSLAPEIGMKTQRGPGFHCIDGAAHQMFLFAQQLNQGILPRHSWHMPTQRQLRKAGRHDLLYALTQYGQASLAKAAQLRKNHRGNPRRKLSNAGATIAHAA